MNSNSSRRGAKASLAVQQSAQNRGQLEDHVPRHIGIETHQRRNRIQRIEQEVRIDLVLQRLHARVQKKPLLLFQFDLDSDAVEDLDLDSNRGDGRGVDRDLRPTSCPGSRCAKIERGKYLRNLRLYEPQADYGRRRT